MVLALTSQKNLRLLFQVTVILSRKTILFGKPAPDVLLQYHFPILALFWRQSRHQLFQPSWVAPKSLSPKRTHCQVGLFIQRSSPRREHPDLCHIQLTKAPLRHENIFHQDGTNVVGCFCH